MLVSAFAVVWVVSRRGRAESRLDEHLDRLVRLQPLAALALTLLSLGYAAWSRPGWQSAGRLPGDETFGTLVLAQGVLVVALAATARRLHATTPERRTVLKGLGGPAVAMLACALGGVMSGGVAQRVADWLDNGSTPGAPGGPIPGPPVLLSWQASVLPPLLVILLAVLVWYAVRTHRHARREEAQVAADHPGEPLDATRTARIAWARAVAAHRPGAGRRRRRLLGHPAARQPALCWVPGPPDASRARPPASCPPCSAAPPPPRRPSAPG